MRQVKYRMFGAMESLFLGKELLSAIKNSRSVAIFTNRSAKLSVRFLYPFAAAWLCKAVCSFPLSFCRSVAIFTDWLVLRPIGFPNTIFLCQQ